MQAQRAGSGPENKTQTSSSRLALPLPQTDPYIGKAIKSQKDRTYTLSERIGTGGAAVVYLATHKSGKSVAVKFVARPSDTEWQTYSMLFYREAKTMATVKHPAIPIVYDFGELNGSFYLVLEYLKGKTLSEILKERKTLSWDETRRIIGDVCSGLSEVHSKGVIHRDIKPANIMLLDENSQVKIIDFGTAKSQCDSLATLTAAGIIKGTLFYIAPEVFQDKPTDKRTDIYSVGAVMYEMLAGTVPFNYCDLGHLINAVLSEKLMPPSKRAPEEYIPKKADKIILKALERDPAKRFQDASELLEALNK